MGTTNNGICAEHGNVWVEDCCGCETAQEYNRTGQCPACLEEVTSEGICSCDMIEE